MARELMPQGIGIYVAILPIDAAIGWTQENGTRAHRLAGTRVDHNMADPDYVAETYLQLSRTLAAQLNRPSFPMHVCAPTIWAADHRR